ncbi:putative activator of 90 kDa heat shock protein ATPase2 [Manis javanica]|nr:putative activator of 90 kDa heat shock protein ATPase2 [Manis javanica]
MSGTSFGAKKDPVFTVSSFIFLADLLPFCGGVIKESGAKQKGLIEIPSLSEEKGVDGTEIQPLVAQQNKLFRLQLGSGIRPASTECWCKNFLHLLN